MKTVEVKRYSNEWVIIVLVGLVTAYALSGCGSSRRVYIGWDYYGDQPNLESTYTVTDSNNVNTQRRTK